MVVDTVVSSEDMVELKDSLQQSINFIPEDAMIGLITFGKMVQVHELGFTDCPKCFVFRGDKEMTGPQVQTQLGLTVANDQLNKGTDPSIQRFLVPVGECDFALNSILDDLQCDPWPAPQGDRPARSAGQAMSIAISMLESFVGKGPINRGSRVITLLGGPITNGPGKIVSQSKKQMIRTHLDIQKENENTQYMKPAIKFFQSLADRS